jgi:hypothetical protein
VTTSTTCNVGLRWRVPRGGYAVNAITFCADGGWLAAASDATVFTGTSLDDASDGRCGNPHYIKVPFRGWEPQDIVSGVCLVGPSERIVSCQFDGTVRVQHSVRTLLHVDGPEPRVRVDDVEYRGDELAAWWSRFARYEEPR